MDKFKEECGVFGIFGHTEAANMTYLGLYALQHRGQESVGIATSNGDRLQIHKAMGYVADNFNEATFARLIGTSAVGHVRYSTAGESGINNAQPILIDCAHGEIAVAHNGNLSNAMRLRRTLNRRGSPLTTMPAIAHLPSHRRLAWLLVPVGSDPLVVHANNGPPRNCIRARTS